MQTWKIEITVKVDDSWVADGFDMAQRLEHLNEAVSSMWPYAYSHEFSVKSKITDKPTKEKIRELQGY
jgi:hypothetical protein